MIARTLRHGGVALAALLAAGSAPRAQTVAPAPHVAGFVVHTQTSGAAWNVRTDAAGYRFEVRGRERTGGDEGKNRAEAYLSPGLENGRVYRLSYRLMIEPGPPNTAPWLNLTQIQSSFDKGEPGHGPPISIGLTTDHLVLFTRRSSVRISTPADIVQQVQFKDREALSRGQWYRIALVVRHDPLGAGVVQLWRDGRCVSGYVGPVGFNDARGPYVKFGVYRADNPMPFVAHFGRVQIDQLAAPPRCQTRGA